MLWDDVLIKRTNVYALTGMKVHFVKTPYAKMVVIRIMGNVFILENVYVNPDGKVLIVRNAFRIGIVSMDFVMNLMNANVLTDFLAKIVTQLLNIKMEIGVNGVLGQVVQVLVDQEYKLGKEYVMIPSLSAMDFIVLKMEVFQLKQENVQI